MQALGWCSPALSRLGSIPSPLHPKEVGEIGTNLRLCAGALRGADCVVLGLGLSNVNPSLSAHGISRVPSGPCSPVMLSGGRVAAGCPTGRGLFPPHHSGYVAAPAVSEQQPCSLPSFLPSLPSCSAARQLSKAAKNNLCPLQGGGSHQGALLRRSWGWLWGLVGEFWGAFCGVPWGEAGWECAKS